MFANPDIHVRNFRFYTHMHLFSMDIHINNFDNTLSILQNAKNFLNIMLEKYLCTMHMHIINMDDLQNVFHVVAIFVLFYNSNINTFRYIVFRKFKFY